MLASQLHLTWLESPEVTHHPATVASKPLEQSP